MKSVKFNTEEVKAVLEGNKTQFRLPLKIQPTNSKQEFATTTASTCKKRNGQHHFINPEKPSDRTDWFKRPYEVGDEIFVKESWCLTRASQSYECGDVCYFEWEGTIEEAKECLNHDMVTSGCAARIFYPADGEDENPSEMHDNVGTGGKILSKKEIPWLSASKMPQWASRLTLRVKNIRVERLEDISEEDCEKEGVSCWGGYRIADSDDYTEPQYFFKKEKLPCTCYETEEGPEMCENCLWGSIITYDNPFEPFTEYWDDKYFKHPSESNPWVWVVEFELLTHKLLGGKDDK